MIDLFFESILTVIIGIAGILLIVVGLCCVAAAGVIVFAAVELLLFKLGLVKEPGWVERAREEKEYKSRIINGGQHE